MTIILEDICKSYDGKKVLDNYNLTVEWGRAYALVGPPGCGKSTILKIFMGVEKPDSGQVHRMGDYKYPTLQSAYVSQDGKQLNFKKNAIWNVKKVHRWASKGRAIEELSKFIPEERQTVPLSELTDVELRFVEIVRALFVPADFIVFDEPFLGMNQQEMEKAKEYILKIRGTRPFLLATRNPEGIDFAKIVNLP
jgi:ABC-type branched-subunit amino acid transport system ATPase component